jgi:deoxyribodipyrimidine photo-lyase
VVKCSPQKAVVALAKRASIVVCDCGYLRIQKKWRQEADEKLECPLPQVETDIIVPVAIASKKEEYSAATFRPKITRLISEFTLTLPKENPKIDSSRLEDEPYDIYNIGRTLADIKTDDAVRPVPGFHGGTAEAKKRLAGFIREKLSDYGRARNDPNADCTSNLSPYFHFGQVSPLCSLNSNGETVYALAKRQEINFPNWHVGLFLSILS